MSANTPVDNTLELDAGAVANIKQLSRREFLSLTGRAGGALMIASSVPLAAGLSASSAEAKPGTHSGSSLGMFVSIADNGDVNVVCHRMEMGQGILTSTPQIIAEELCADWNRVTAVLGEANAKYGNQSTGGSASIRRFIEHTRQMGAVARDMLEQAAANKWGVAKSSVAAKNHEVMHKGTGNTLSFGELAKSAAELPVPDAQSVSLKPIKDFSIVGKDVPLQGLESIVRAKATYAQDIQLPGMLIASIERPPVVGGKVKSFDASDAKKVQGVVDVVRLKDRNYPVQVQPKSGVAVLATNTWAALEGRKRLSIEWDHGANQSHDSQAYKKDLVAKVNAKAKQVRVVGDVYAHEFDSAKTVEATYTVPYHHHMSMETPAATPRDNMEWYASTAMG